MRPRTWSPRAWAWPLSGGGGRTRARVTQEDWLRPDLKELFPELAARGLREVLVVPVQFLSDHLEVLYDLDVAAADEARAVGLRYRRIQMPNTRPSFIRALAALATASARARTLPMATS